MAKGQVTTGRSRTHEAAHRVNPKTGGTVQSIGKTGNRSRKTDKGGHSTSAHPQHGPMGPTDEPD